jgi:hypothetical protein
MNGELVGIPRIAGDAIAARVSTPRGSTFVVAERCRTCA